METPQQGALYHARTLLRRFYCKQSVNIPEDLLQSAEKKGKMNLV